MYRISDAAVLSPERPLPSPVVSTPAPERLRAVLPGLVRGLLDDAAVFPPGNATVADAVAAHREHRRSWYADAVGPLLVRPNQVGELLAATRGGDDLDVGLVADATAGLAGLLAGAREMIDLEDRARLVQAEIALPSGHDPARATQVLVEHLTLSVTTYVEVPRTDYAGALDVLAHDGAERAKYRTGGLTASAVPTDAELAGFLRAALDRRLPFKLTAGLHHAVRGTAPDGMEQHGFLNVLAAVSAAADGADAAQLERLLAERAAAGLFDALAGADVAAVRAAFVSFGCCGVQDPVADLVTLGLLDDGQP
jgi:hypothetical protein